MLLFTLFVLARYNEWSKYWDELFPIEISELLFHFSDTITKTCPIPAWY